MTALKTHAPKSVKFSSGMQEDLNEVFYLAQGQYDQGLIAKLEEQESRTQRMGMAINTLKLPKALLLNKLQVAYHVSEMRTLSN